MLNTICVLSRRERETTLDARGRARAARRTLERCDARARRTPHARPRPTSLSRLLSLHRSLPPTILDCSLRTCASHARVAALPIAANEPSRLPTLPGPTARQLAAPPATDTRFPRTRHTARILTGKTGCPSSRANEERGVRRTAISTASDGGERGGSTHCRPRTGAVCTHVWPHVSAHFVFIFLRLHLPLLALRAHLMVLI